MFFFQDERFVGAEATRVRHKAWATAGLDYRLLSCDDMQPCHLLVYIIWLRGSRGSALFVNLTKAFNWFYLLLYSSLGLRDLGFVVEIQALIFHSGLGWKRMMMFCEHILMYSSRCRAFNSIVTVLVSIKNLNKSKSGLMMTKDDLMANEKIVAT